jgi:hypothetical protein
MTVLATLCCAVFAGAAIYVNVVEHPARMSCGVPVALAEWAPSYKRATVMQASLAVLGFGFAIIACLAGGGVRVAVGGVLLGLVVPWTLIVMMPINKRLAALDPSKDLPQAAALLPQWNRLHSVRSLLSAIALIVLLSAARS